MVIFMNNRGWVRIVEAFLAILIVSAGLLIVLSRQPDRYDISEDVYEKQDSEWQQTIRRGAYVVRDCAGVPDLVLIASGSEVNMALAAQAKLSDRKIRVVSMLSRGLFLSQNKTFQKSILPEGVEDSGRAGECAGTGPFPSISRVIPTSAG